MDQVRELLALIARLKEDGLTGIGIAANFVLRRLQPAKERARPAFEYFADGDQTREVPEQMRKAAAVARLRLFFAPGTPIRSSGIPAPFSLGNPRPVVCIL